jgi:hypothetical protein
MSIQNEIGRFIEIEVSPEIRQKQFTAEDLTFWANDPRDAVIFASGSIRKAVMALAQLKKFSFKVIESFIDGEEKEIELTSPKELIEYFERNISNGNGALKEKTFFGYLFGVPCYAQPSNGETDSNESPLEEAENKVVDLYDDYAGEYVLIISTDTVDRPNISKVPLGKPENREDFPKRSDYTEDDDFNIQLYDEEIANYLERFKNEFYTASDSIIHTNAVAVLDAATGRLIELKNQILELNIDVDREKIEEVVVYKDMGGGGVGQQFIEWDDSEAVKSYFDKFTLETLGDINEQQYRMALVCQVMGVPYSIFELLRLAHEEAVSNY